MGRRRHILKALPRVRRKRGASGARRDSVRLGEARREALPLRARRDGQGARRERQGARRTARKVGARVCRDTREARHLSNLREVARPIARECYGLRERVHRFTIGEGVSLVKCSNH